MRGPVIDADGVRTWYHDNGKRARIEWPDGARTTCYHDNGKIARREWPDGSREWYHDNGKLARIEPACPLRAEALRIQRDIAQ